MHAGVGAPRDREALPLGKDHVESVAHHSFDRAEARLARPAVEARSVVLECSLAFTT